MWLILFAVFIDLVGFGLIFPLLPFLTAEFGGSTLAGTALISIYSFMAFLSGPIWGRLSDKIGRKPALVMTFLGGSLSYATFAFADSMLMLFVARAMSGAMAGNVGIVMATMADLTDAKNRGRAMGLIGAAFALGFSVGPGISSAVAHITGETSTLMPGLIASALSLTAATLTFFLMPETNPQKIVEESTREESTREENTGEESTKVRPHATVSQPSWRDILSMPDLQLVLLMIWVTAIGQSTNFTLTPYWLTATHDWTIAEVGGMMMMVGFVVAFIQSVLLGPLFRLMGELGAMVLGAQVFILASLMLWIADSSEIFAIIAFTLLVSGLTITFPAMNGMLSKRTDANIQGTVMGLSNGVAALGRVVGPLTGGLLFSEARPSMPFLIVTGVGLAVIIWARFENRKQTQLADNSATPSDQKVEAQA